jgi:hypothetical protein
MRNEPSLLPERAERKENLFLPSFPLRSRQSSRYSKVLKKEDLKNKSLMSPEQVKILYDQIGIQKGLTVPPVKRDQIKLKNFRFKYRSTPPVNDWSPSKNCFISRLLQRRENDLVVENYKFMLTGANFSYLNNRILEKDSSSNTLIHELPSLDARYKHLSPEPREVVFDRNSKGFIENDYLRRKIFKY